MRYLINLVASLILLPAIATCLGCTSEITRKLSEYGKANFTSLADLFDHYDGNEDGRLDKREVEQLLTDASISWLCNRPSLVLDYLDADRDHLLSQQDVIASIGDIKGLGSDYEV